EHRRVAERDEQAPEHDGRQDGQEGDDGRAALHDRRHDRVVQRRRSPGRRSSGGRPGLLGAHGCPSAAAEAGRSAPAGSGPAGAAGSSPPAAAGSSGSAASGAAPSPPAPAISIPSSSAETVGGRKPVILPSYMTAMRSARA